MYCVCTLEELVRNGEIGRRGVEDIAEKMIKKTRLK